ncbi:E3 ubiquitin-protein ligase RHA2B-like [Impatiens glandulifera]|uniref:E3 ubiquitin-protein ligase RHA2B-like n=1 Tax=Impatiens glandulifera TaxID=253017 RepID=UPI001FB0528D|nr:E3 ubiquitin-protein ligase RHA2B-like [Impatiens glandulifera]
MGAVYEFLSHLYTMTIVFFTVLLLQLIILIRTVAGTILHSCNKPITPTRYLELIEEKNPASRYKRKSSIHDPAECAVCLSALEEGEEVRRLNKCGHTFHRLCLDTWLQGDCATCPLCRTMVVPEEIVVRYRRRHSERSEYEESDDELIFLLSAFHGSNLYRLM